VNQQKRWPFAADLNDDQIHKIWRTMFDIFFFHLISLIYMTLDLNFMMDECCYMSR
jgi:hypothetical protein